MRAWRNGRRAIQALGLALAGQAAAHAAIYEVAVGQYNVTHASLRMYNALPPGNDVFAAGPRW